MPVPGWQHSLVAHVITPAPPIIGGISSDERCIPSFRGNAGPFFSWWITTTAGGADGEAWEGFAAQGMPRTLQPVDFDNSRMRRAMTGLSAVAPVTTSTNDSGTVVR